MAGSNWNRIKKIVLEAFEHPAAGAEPVLRRALFSARWINVDAEEPHRFARLESDYGRCLIDLRRHDEAEDILVRAHARAREWAGPHSTVAEQAATQLERLRGER